MRRYHPVGGAPYRLLAGVALLAVASGCDQQGGGLLVPGTADARTRPPRDGGALGPAPAVVIPEQVPVDAALPDRATRPPGPTPPGGEPPATDPGPSPQSVAVYDESRVVDFFLSFPPGEFERMKTIPAAAGDQRWVPCSLTFLGETSTDAYCRRKGDPTSWTAERKPQMLVRFNFVNKQGRFRGLRRLNLESLEGNPAPIRDRLGMWLMREAGIDAPRVNHARVFLEGRYFGLFQNIEAVDKEFIEDHFRPDSGGNLWESADELKTNEALPLQTRLFDLDDLVFDEPIGADHTAFFANLDELLDISQILRVMAAETILLTEENFSNGGENFFFYEHPRRGLMVIPWDLDSILTGGTATPDSDPFEFWGSNPAYKMRLLINQNPGWRTQFIDQVVEIRERYMVSLSARATFICTQLTVAAQTDPNGPPFDEVEADCALVKNRITERTASLRRLLGR